MKETLGLTREGPGMVAEVLPVPPAAQTDDTCAKCYGRRRDHDGQGHEFRKLEPKPGNEGELLLKRESRELSKAMSLLVAWLTKPNTARHVRRIEQQSGAFSGSVWFVELSAGGFPFRSETQTELSGAIRSALQAAEMGARGE